MNRITIVLIFIIVIIALVMAFILIMSNAQTKNGGPSFFEGILNRRGNPENNDKEEEEDTVTVTDNLPEENSPEDVDTR